MHRRPSLLFSPMRSLRVLTLVSLLATPAFAGLAVSPMQIDKQLLAGDNTFELVVSNNGDAPLRIQLATGPLAHDRRGAPIKGTDPRFDASTLIRFEKPEFILAPRRWRRIRAHVDGNARTNTGGYAFVFVRGTDANPAAGTQLVATLEMAVAVELGFPGATAPTVELDAPRITADGVRVPVRNLGKLHTRPEGRLVVKDASGKAVWTGKLASAVVFPGLERELAIEPALPALASGQYSAEVELTSPRPTRLSRALAVIDGQVVVARAPAQH